MLVNDVRFALRQLKQNPGFVLAVTFTLALGVGVNTAVFSLVNAFFLRPLPYPEPDRLAVLILHQEGVSKSGQFEQQDDPSQDGETWEMVRDNLPAVKAASFGGTSGVNLQSGSSADSNARYVQNMRVSAHYFEVLGIQPFLGRSFTEEEDRPNGPNAVILSHALWRTQFHADATVLGRPVILKGEPYTVVGVLPERAQPTGVADVWTPLQPHQSGECGGNNCEIILRLVPGATWEQASVQLGHLHKPAFDEIAKSKGRAWFYASPLARNLDNGMGKPILGLMTAVGLILLIACANLAGLALVRIVRRSPEIATRLALGASRWTILRQLWVESSVLASQGHFSVGHRARDSLLATGIPAGFHDPAGRSEHRCPRSRVHVRSSSGYKPAFWCAAGLANATRRSPLIDRCWKSICCQRIEPPPAGTHRG